MAWMRAVCGRLEMRYRYSKDVVYNNFPWPSPQNDRAVMAAYGFSTKMTESECVAELFKRYAELMK